MPVVIVKLLEGRTAEQKTELAQAITEAVVKIAKTTAEGTQVIYEDTKRSDWFSGGKSH